MLPVEDQLSILVHLSKADNFVAKEENNLIHAIGERNGLTPEEVDAVINNPKPIPNLENLPPDEKFESPPSIHKIYFSNTLDRTLHPCQAHMCFHVRSVNGIRIAVLEERRGKRRKGQIVMLSNHVVSSL